MDQEATRPPSHAARALLTFPASTLCFLIDSSQTFHKSLALVYYPRALFTLLYSVFLTLLYPRALLTLLVQHFLIDSSLIFLKPLVFLYFLRPLLTLLYSELYLLHWFQHCLLTDSSQVFHHSLALKYFPREDAEYFVNDSVTQEVMLSRDHSFIIQLSDLLCFSVIGALFSTSCCPRKDREHLVSTKYVWFAHITFLMSAPLLVFRFCICHQES